jgi:hypothetical protein
MDKILEKECIMAEVMTKLDILLEMSLREINFTISEVEEMAPFIVLCNMTMATALSAQNAFYTLIDQEYMAESDERLFLRACRFDGTNKEWEDIDSEIGDQDVNELILANYLQMMIGESGEGVCALYYLRKLLEKETPSVTDIINEMYHYGMLNTSYGMIQCGIADYLMTKGYNVTYKYSKLDDKAKDADAAILCYIISGVFHVVTIQKSDEEQYYFYFPSKEPEQKTFAEIKEELGMQEIFSINIQKSTEPSNYQGEPDSEDGDSKIIPIIRRKQENKMEEQQ